MRMKRAQWIATVLVISVSGLMAGVSQTPPASTEEEPRRLPGAPPPGVTSMPAPTGIPMRPLRPVEPQQPLDIGLFETRLPENPAIVVPDE